MASFGTGFGKSSGAASREGLLGLKYAGCSLVGFATDAALLHLLTAAGMEAAWARVISLTCAMQVTFVINGLHVFRCLTWRELPRQWGSYMLSNGFGNFCNYWIFVTLVSLHWRVVSVHMVALTIAAFCAWMINYCATRFWVFRRHGHQDAAGAPRPSPVSPSRVP